MISNINKLNQFEVMARFRMAYPKDWPYDRMPSWYFMWAPLFWSGNSRRNSPKQPGSTSTRLNPLGRVISNGMPADVVADTTQKKPGPCS